MSFGSSLACGGVPFVRASQLYSNGVVVNDGLFQAFTQPGSTMASLVYVQGSAGEHSVITTFSVAAVAGQTLYIQVRLGDLVSGRGCERREGGRDWGVLH